MNLRLALSVTRRNVGKVLRETFPCAHARINLYEIKLCRLTYLASSRARPHVAHRATSNKRRRREESKEESRKGKKEIKEAVARCRHLDHGTHFASLISRKDSVRVTGVFRLQGLLETRGSPLLRSGI